MNKLQLERMIAVAILKAPTVAQMLILKAEWFSNLVFRKIFELNFEKPFDDLMSFYYELKLSLQEKNMNVQLEFNDLLKLSEEISIISNLDNIAKELHVLFLREELTKLQKEYAKFPNPQTEKGMLDILVAMQRVEDLNKNSGEIHGTMHTLREELYQDVPQGIQSYAQMKSMLGTGLTGGMLFILGARPAVGKSAWLINFIDKALQKNSGLKIDLFSGEMNKKEIMRRIISFKTQIPLYKLKNASKLLLDTEKEIVSQSIENYQHHDLNIHKEMYIDDVIRIIRRRAAEAQPDKHLVCIDYLGLLRIRNFKRETRFEVEYITRELKILAEELQIPILLLSQLNRAVETRQDKRPMLSDLRESGAIEQDANVVAFLYQNMDINYPITKERDMEIIIAKNRDGMTGKMHFKFYPEKMKFEEEFIKK